MPKLYPEDQKKVDEVLGKGIYRPDRKPFKVWLLLLGLLLVLAVLTGISYWIALAHDFA